MESKILTGNDYKKLILNATANLKLNVKIVNDLNVFPVPDGDTGDNMRLTMEGGTKACKDIEESNIGMMSKTIAHGMFLGARGNSGVILSQFFDGLAKGLKNYDKINTVEFVNVLKNGVAKAYAAVINPTEGTILTVMKDSTNYVESIVTEETTFVQLFEALLKEARESIERTPSLLPVLAEAGVVDSGGVGFSYVVEGMLKALKGEKIEDVEVVGGPVAQQVNTGSFGPDSELEYGYCTEFLLQLQNSKCIPDEFDIDTLIEFMKTIGDSIVCFKNGSIVKTHVHTKQPGKIMNYAQKFGEFVSFKLENMSVQHTEATVENNYKPVKKEVEKKHKKYATVAVAAGEGIINTFKDFGADAVVEGGQTMNPSVEDFMETFDTLNADNIIVFPNNSNIILTAEQVAKHYRSANVYVVHSKSIAEGYSALTMIDLSSDDIETILANLNELISNVDSGEITYAVRDANLDGVEIKKDDYIAMSSKKMIASCKTKLETVTKLVDYLDPDQEKEVLTIIYGKNVSENELNEIVETVQAQHDNLEVYPIDGKHDVYDFIVIAE